MSPGPLGGPGGGLGGGPRQRLPRIGYVRVGGTIGETGAPDHTPPSYRMVGLGIGLFTVANVALVGPGLLVTFVIGYVGYQYLKYRTARHRTSGPGAPKVLAATSFTVQEEPTDRSDPHASHTMIGCVIDGRPSGPEVALNRGDPIRLTGVRFGIRNERVYVLSLFNDKTRVRQTSRFSLRSTTHLNIVGVLLGALGLVQLYVAFLKWAF